MSLQLFVFILFVMSPGIKKNPLQVHAKGWSNNFVFFLYVGLPRDLFIYLFNVHEKSIMYAF